MSTRTLLPILVIAGGLPAADATALAARPPMGWNSYDAFPNKIDEDRFTLDPVHFRSSSP